MADQTIATLTARLKLNAVSFTKGIKQAKNETTRLGKALDTAIGKRAAGSIRGLSKEMKVFEAESRKAVKNISRVITGILIAQGFYRLLGVIQDLIAEVARFSQDMEKASIVFTQLMDGNVEKANSFLSALEDMAAVTPLQITPLKGAAQQLIAMGVNAEGVIPLLWRMSDAVAAIGGGNQELESMANVFSRIIGKGTITGREVLSLSNLKVPIYDILREQLGLSTDQIRNIAREGISATDSINAILAGFQKFEGLSARLATTLPGLISTMKDNLLFLGKDISTGLYEEVKTGITNILTELMRLRVLAKEGGLRAVVSDIFQPWVVVAIYQFAAGIKEVYQAFRNLASALKPLIGTALAIFLKVMSKLLTVFAFAINIIAKLIRSLLEMSPVLNLLAARLAQLLIINTVVFAALKLVGAFRLLLVVMNPTILAIGVIGSLLVYLGSKIDYVRIKIEALKGAISGLFKTSLDPDKAKETGQEIYNWGEGFSIGANSAEGMEDAVEDADKAVKRFLTSFDEVVNIPESLDDVANAFNSMVPSTLPSGGGLALPEIEIPDLTSYWDDLGGGMTETLDSLGATFMENIIAWKDLSIIIVKNWIKGVELESQLFHNRMKASYKTFWEDLKKDFDTFKKNFLLSFSIFNSDVSASWNALTKNLKDAFKRFTEDIYRVWTTFKDDLLQVWNDFKVGVLAIFSPITNAFEIFWRGLKEKVEKLKKTLSELWKKFTEGELSVSEFATQALKTIGLFVVEVIKSFATLVTKVGIALLELPGKVIKVFVDLVDGVLGVILKLPGEVAKTFTTLVEGVWKAFGGFFVNLKADFGALAGNIGESLKRLKDDVKATFANLWNDTKKNVGLFFSGLLGGFDDTFTKILGFITKAISKLKEFLGLQKDADSTDWSKGLGGVSGGGSSSSKPGISYPSGFANGGIISREGMIKGSRVGERDKSELIAPLDEEKVSPIATPIARAIVKEMMNQGGSGNSSGESARAIFIAADEASLKKLERKLEIVRISENQRKGGE